MHNVGSDKYVDKYGKKIFIMDARPKINAVANIVSRRKL